MQGSALHPPKDFLKKVLRNPKNFGKGAIGGAEGTDETTRASPWGPAHWCEGDVGLHCRDRRSTAVRSRSRSDNAPRCHSLRSRRFATPAARVLHYIGCPLSTRKPPCTPEKFRTVRRPVPTLASIDTSDTPTLTWKHPYTFSHKSHIIRKETEKETDKEGNQP